MADITGTDSPETLDGTADADTIEGLGGNDTLNGLDGDDTLDGGLGTDAVHGGAGNDTIVMAEFPSISFSGMTIVGETIDGGADFDTLELRVFDDSSLIAPTVLGPTSGYGLYQATLTGLEQLRFVSTTESGVGALMFLTQLTGAGITTLTGAVGRDFLDLRVPNGGGTYTVPSLALSGWTNSSTPHLTGDLVSLSAGTGDFTLNALEGLASAQALYGSLGNDTLNGSSGSEMLDGGGGVNVLDGNGGNDLLAVANANDFFGNPTTYTGAGSTFDGGTGTDLLSIGGLVNFQGSLVSIEGIYLQPSVDSPAANNALDQPEAHLTITDALLDTLPGDLELQGTGTITVNMAHHDVFDGSGFVHTAGSAVSLVINGTRWRDSISDSSGDNTLNGGDGNDDLDAAAGGIDTVNAGDGRDDIAFGAEFTGADTVDGGSGNDRLSLQGDYAGANALVLGEDTLAAVEEIILEPGTAGNFYDYDITTHDANVAAGERLVVDGSRLRSGEDLTFDGSAETDGQFRILGGRGADVLIGGAGADQLRGGRGADNMTGGGGADELTGNEGADTFRYDDVSDSGIGSADRVLDFTPGTDTIDLSAIDADIGTAGNQAFSWIGRGAFSGAAGELRAERVSGAWQVSGDTDGDGAADFLILVTATPGPVTSADFIV